MRQCYNIACVEVQKSMVMHILIHFHAMVLHYLVEITTSNSNHNIRKRMIVLF